MQFRSLFCAMASSMVLSANAQVLINSTAIGPVGPETHGGTPSANPTPEGTLTTVIIPGGTTTVELTPEGTTIILPGGTTTYLPGGSPGILTTIIYPPATQSSMVAPHYSGAQSSISGTPTSILATPEGTQSSSGIPTSSGASTPPGSAQNLKSDKNAAHHNVVGKAVLGLAVLGGVAML